MSTPTASPKAVPRHTVRVAAVQSAPVAFDLYKSLHKLRSLAFAARENGAELVVFPEAWLSGYPRHLEFRIGSRTTESREWYARYVRSSVRIPRGAEGTDWLGTSVEQRPDMEYWAFQQLAQIARKYTLYLSVGVVEASNVGSTLWCTNLLFGPTGMLLSKHRKLQPTGAERTVWAQGEATNPTGLKRERGQDEPRTTDNLPVVATGIGKIGGLICWENFMPLARYLLYKKGVEIYIAPTADGRPTWLPTMQHIAQEGRCFVITAGIVTRSFTSRCSPAPAHTDDAANQYHGSTDFPSDYPPTLDRASGGAEKNEVWSRGGSAIISPLGEVLAGPLWDKEGIVTADLDLSLIDGYKLDFDVVGHYSREDMLLGLLNNIVA